MSTPSNVSSSVSAAFTATSAFLTALSKVLSRDLCCVTAWLPDSLPLPTYTTSDEKSKMNCSEYKFNQYAYYAFRIGSSRMVSTYMEVCT